MKHMSKKILIFILYLLVPFFIVLASPQAVNATCGGSYLADQEWYYWDTTTNGPWTFLGWFGNPVTCSPEQEITRGAWTNSIWQDPYWEGYYQWSCQSSVACQPTPTPTPTPCLAPPVTCDSFGTGLNCFATSCGSSCGGSQPNYCTSSNGQRLCCSTPPPTPTLAPSICTPGATRNVCSTTSCSL